VSLMTPAPSQEMQDLIDDIRKPQGRTLMHGGDLLARPARSA
jgi:hypothetical protein